MASPRSAGENGSGGGADAVGDAFQQVAQELAQLQEALRQQKQEAERKVQEALQLHKQEAERKIQEAERRMQVALRLQEERTSAALRDIERKLERDATIRDFRQRHQEAQEITTASEGSPADSLQNLESRAGQSDSDGSLQSAVETFLPTLFESLLRTLEQQSPHPSLSTAPATGGAAAGGEEEPPSSSSTPSGAGHQGAAADEEEGERQKVERRVREVLLNLERARASPSPLGEQLCEAAYEGSTRDVIRLLDSGADVNYTNGIGYTPLLSVALRSADPFLLAVLVQRGADVNAITSVGNSALHWAAMSDFDGSCVERLVREGADVDARNVHGETPLLIAARSNNVEAVYKLLAARARKDLRPWGGFEKDKPPFDLATSPLVRSLLRD